MSSYFNTYLPSFQHQLRFPTGEELPGEYAVLQSALTETLKSNTKVIFAETGGLIHLAHIFLSENSLLYGKPAKPARPVHSASLQSHCRELRSADTLKSKCNHIYIQLFENCKNII